MTQSLHPVVDRKKQAAGAYRKRLSRVVDDLEKLEARCTSPEQKVMALKLFMEAVRDLKHERDHGK